ncbi:MAG: M48 family metalloprotease, partial [Dehalococcoidia bacterium]|nr:M48 family metalloprotease [Dehalococcoidia bacterium]
MGKDSPRHLKGTPRQSFRKLRELSVVEGVLGFLLPAVFLFSGTAHGLRDVLPDAFLVRVALYAIIAVAIYCIFYIPFFLYKNILLPRPSGQSVHPCKGLLIDQLKILGLGTGAAVLLVVAVYSLMSLFAATWWLWAGLFIAALSFFLTKTTPSLILPLFVETHRLPDASLTGRLKDLGRRAGVRIDGVFSTGEKGRTFLTGITLLGTGNSQRIVLDPEVMRKCTPEEIESVVAHEMGHCRHSDILRIMLIQSCFIISAFFVTHLVLIKLSAPLGFSGLADIANLPLVILTMEACFFLVSPLLRAYNRHLETAADIFALRLTANPAAFITAITKLTGNNRDEA